MKRALFTVVATVVLVTTGCVIKDPGYSLFLGSNIAPSQPPTCTYEPTSTTIIPYGVLDLTAAKGGCLVDTSIPCYQYNPALKNQMLSVTTDTVGFANLTEDRADANNVVIEGFYMTYEVGDTPHVDTDGQDIPGATTAFVGSNASVIPPGGTSTTGVDLLPQSVLDGLQQANGKNFRVYVHVKATSRTQEGRTIGSNEVLYMVDVCTDCLVACSKALPVVDVTKVCIYGQDAHVGCTAATATAR